MRRRLSVRKRLERLEAAQAKAATKPYTEALIEIGDCDEDCERHLVMTSSDRGRFYFREEPGPGPQLADFGEFSFVMHLTYAEMNG